MVVKKRNRQRQNGRRIKAFKNKGNSFKNERIIKRKKQASNGQANRKTRKERRARKRRLDNLEKHTTLPPNWEEQQRAKDALESDEEQIVEIYTEENKHRKKERRSFEDETKMNQSNENTEQTISGKNEIVEDSEGEDDIILPDDKTLSILNATSEILNRRINFIPSKDEHEDPLLSFKKYKPVKGSKIVYEYSPEMFVFFIEIITKQVFRNHHIR